MRKPSTKLLRSLSLVAVLLVGASAQRLAAQSAPQSFNFNSQSDSGWTHYDLNNQNPGYPPNTYSFPANTAGPAGNYGYRIQIPVYTDDPNLVAYPRGGSFVTGVTFGNSGDANGGRVTVGADLIGYNNNWSDMEVGIAWDVNPDIFFPSAYLAGWGPGEKTLGLAKIKNAVPALIGLVTPGTTRLQTSHQYRIVGSTHDASTLLVQIFDLAQPNNPWMSAITTDSELANDYVDGYSSPHNGGGTVGMMGADLLQITPSNTEGADATWDNVSASSPAFVDPGSAPAVMPVTVTDLTPPPAGVATSPILEVGFLNRDTGVNSISDPNGWIKLFLDGVQIPIGQLTIDPTNVHKWHNNDEYGSGYGAPTLLPTNYPGATVTYTMPNLFVAGSLHTNTVVFEDDSLRLHTNTWSWTVGYAQFAPSGSLSVRGFDARLVVSTAAGLGGGSLPNSVANAQVVLATPYQYALNMAATNWTQVVAWDIGNDINADPPVPWHNGAITNYPGQCYPTAFPNSFAVEVLGYIQLAAGTNHFYIASDDAVGVYTGGSLTDTTGVLYENNGVAHDTFTWVVAQAGLYPIHIIHEEGGGDAYLVLHSGTDDTGPLVNTPGAPQVYYPLVCMSSTAAKGPYTVDAAANAGLQLAYSSGGCDGTGSTTPGNVQNLTVTGGTLTFPIPSAPKYYRLNGPRQTKITSITKSGANLVINYQAQ